MPARLAPRTIEGQMIAVLAISLVLVLMVLAAFELIARDTPLQWAQSAATLQRIARMRTVVENVPPRQRAGFIRTISRCHDGHALSAAPYAGLQADARTDALKMRIAQRLSVSEADVAAGYATLTRADFAYATCNQSEIALPMHAVVISIRLSSGEWLHTEVHPHEWHGEVLLAQLLRYAAACTLVAIPAILLMHRLSRPLNELTRAARGFAQGLVAAAVREAGPPDVRRAIEAFNVMQEQVASEVNRRTDTLAAISHDLRTPLTALRIRAELVEDQGSRADLIATINRMERIVASALEFLRGESRSEPLRDIDLSAMLASECSDFEEAGRRAEYTGETGVQCTCRPEALARAVRNLIDNANKYADGARVGLERSAGHFDIVVCDTGPGIPEDQFQIALEPFRRLSKARESHQGGFGLGLAVAQAIARGHEGEIILRANRPSGLIVTLRLPRRAARTTMATR